MMKNFFMHRRAVADEEHKQRVQAQDKDAASQLSRYSGMKLLHDVRSGRVLLCTDGETAGQVRCEMRILASTIHPNIVPLLASFEEAGSIFLVMEYAPCGDLFEVAGRYPRRQLPEQTICKNVMLPLCQAVAFLHSRGIIHRDIKPENVVVDGKGISKLCDFGLAVDTAIESPVGAVSTLEFMAPELLRLPALSQRELDRQRKDVNGARYTNKVDVWALGCLAFELLLGRSPFVTKGADNSEMRAAILAGVPQLNSLPPPVSTSSARHLCAIRFIHAALTYDAASRPSAEQLLGLDWLTTEGCKEAAEQRAEGRSAQQDAPRASARGCESLPGRDKRFLRVDSSPSMAQLHPLAAPRREGRGDQAAELLGEAPLPAPAPVQLKGCGSSTALGACVSKQLRDGHCEPRQSPSPRLLLIKKLPQRTLTVPSVELGRILGGSSSAFSLLGSGCGSATAPSALVDYVEAARACRHSASAAAERTCRHSASSNADAVPEHAAI